MWRHFQSPYSGFDRKRRTPFFYAAPRFWKSHKAAADEEDDDLENEEEGKISPFRNKAQVKKYFIRFEPTTFKDD